MLVVVQMVPPVSVVWRGSTQGGICGRASLPCILEGRNIKVKGQGHELKNVQRII